MGVRGHVPIPFVDELELSDEGFVLEANRQFFHPLGLYLMVQMLDDGCGAKPKLFDA